MGILVLVSFHANFQFNLSPQLLCLLCDGGGEHCHPALDQTQQEMLPRTAGLHSLGCSWDVLPSMLTQRGPRGERWWKLSYLCQEKSHKHLQLPLTWCIHLLSSTAASHRIFVTWLRRDSSFSEKLSSVAALGDREQNNSAEEGKQCLYFYLGLPGQTCC